MAKEDFKNLKIDLSQTFSTLVILYVHIYTKADENLGTVPFDENEDQDEDQEDDEQNAHHHGPHDGRDIPTLFLQNHLWKKKPSA